jgi:hypothetical protein
MDALCGVHGVNNRFGKENDYQKKKILLFVSVHSIHQRYW